MQLRIQGDQKVSVHLRITVQSSRAQRLFDHPVYVRTYIHTHTFPFHRSIGHQTVDRIRNWLQIYIFYLLYWTWTNLHFFH